MALDSSVSIPIAESTYDSGQAKETCPEMEKCTDTWSYMFVHNRKAGPLIAKIAKDGLFKTFIHKTIRYKKSRNGNKPEDVKPTVSGLVFIQGAAKAITKYLNDNIPEYHLVNDCATHQVAVIPDSVMQPFMRIVEADPVKVRFLLNPISKYARGNSLVQVMTGPLAGLQGYIIRIDRDRKLVMQVGDMTVAIGGVHKEHFENVETFARSVSACVSNAGNKRCLTEIQENIDKSLFKPESFGDVLAVAANLGIWQDRAMRYYSIGQCERTIEILPFLIEEIGYYLTELYGSREIDIDPILVAGRAVASQIRTLLEENRLSEAFHQELESKYEEQIIRHGYMLGVEI